VSKEDFRRELNAVFDEMSGSPSPALRDRVRSSVAQAPGERGGPYWIAAVAACLIAALIVGVLVVANPLKNRQSNAGPAQPTPSAQPSPTADTNLPPFVCTTTNFVQPTSNATQPPTVFINALRTGTHSGYDRLTIEFANGYPNNIELRQITGTKFMQSPSGMEVTLKGSNGVLITMRGADLHTSYSGSTDIVTGYTSLAEVRRVQDFEGVVQLGLGISGSGCYRAFLLSNPTRLVVDVPVPSPG
jgi:hypothetical protein